MNICGPQLEVGWLVYDTRKWLFSSTFRHIVLGAKKL